MAQSCMPRTYGPGWESWGDRDVIHRTGQFFGKTRYGESVNGKLKDERLNVEMFYSLKEAQIVIEVMAEEYNTRRPHSTLDAGYVSHRLAVKSKSLIRNSVFRKLVSK